ncbi:MAG: VOC family protein [Lentisphaeria bacterium]|nr:VOC family protein [Candidatus Neomarinimicrobiota bacterium]MCF7842411.1 VOC family protein [Lentisphaeria bacterium]
MKWFKQFDCSWLPVSDFERAVEFYEKQLELKPLDINWEQKWAEFYLSPGAKLAIHGLKATNANPLGAVVLAVDNLEQSELWLRGKGIKLYDKREIGAGDKMASFDDPDGNVIQLLQPVGRGGQSGD